MKLQFGRTLIAAAALAVSTGTFAADITGAGATFPYPIYAKWAEAYKKETGIGMNYQSIGSGGGIKQIKAKTVDFGASDKPLKPEELEKDGLTQFPTVMGGVVPVINVDGIKEGQIKLTGAVLADIFLGKIKKWNDPAIVASEQGRHTCLTATSPWCTVPTVPAPPSSSPTTCPRSARNGKTRSAQMLPCPGLSAPAARATKVWPLRASRSRVRSATSNPLTPCRTR